MTELPPETATSSFAPSRSAYVGVFLLAASIILLQIALTRVLAVMMWHHLTYVVISIALLGFGASGSILTLQRARGGGTGNPRDSMALLSALFGAGTLGSLALLRIIEVDSLRLASSFANLAALFAMFVVTALPFLLGGMALGTALTRYPKHVNRVYFVDLIGSGIGGALSVPFLMWTGASTTMVLAALMALASAACFVSGTRAATRAKTSVLLVGGAAVGLLFSGAGPTLGLPQWHWEPPFAQGKMMSAFQDDEGVDRLYSATAQVEIAPERRAVAIIGGDFGISALEMVDARLVGQDGDAPTMLIRNGADLESVNFLANTQTATSHIARKATGHTDPKVLVIGVGGGIDVIIALLHGAASVTAVEINTAMIDMVTRIFDEYIGGLFRPGAHPYSDSLNLVNAEGRSYVTQSDEKFDVIQMSGVDSLAALNTGAYTLSESYLYTTEAVKTFFAHLTDTGYVNYSRQMLAYPQRPRETLRLANIAWTALDELGVEEPESHIAVFCGRAWASTMIKRQPFTEAEIRALHEFGQREGFVGLVFNPLPTVEAAPLERPTRIGVPDSTLYELIRRHMPETTEEHVVAVAVGLRAGFPTLLGTDLEARDATYAGLIAEYPAALRDQAHKGLGEVLLAILTVNQSQRANLEVTRAPFDALLRGDDAQRAEFLASYPNDVSACTDDSPFFFNYYSYSQLLAKLFSSDESKKNDYGYPAGHLVLLASMGQILLLAVVLILLPLRGLAKRQQRVPGTWRYFTFFAALGMGFMFVEIVLMQKMAIFLGHPTFAISVVLTVLLLSAGTGSLLCGRMKTLSRGSLLSIGAAIVLAIFGLAWFCDAVLIELLGFSLPIRVLIAAAVIAPLGLLLGMPFPTGMRLAERDCPQLLPWCWAVNGFLSVFASMFCIFVSMQIGFATALIAAAFMYAIGFWVLDPRRGAGATAPAA